MLRVSYGDVDLMLGGDGLMMGNHTLQMLTSNNWQYLKAAEGSSYSYVYRGRTGSLDHALASPALAKQLKAMQHWAINADEPTLLDYNTEYKSEQQQKSLYAPTPYRSSDHDPLLATFQF